MQKDDYNLNIIYEDDYILAIDKQTGIIVNRSDTAKNQPTVQDLLEKKYSYTSNISDENSDFYKRNGIIHRIDKDTSGILLVAKDEDTFKKMQLLFKNREIRKSYTAVVYDYFKDLNEGAEFTIDAPIGRNPNRRDKFAVVADGKPALTEFQIKKYINIKSIDLTILECYPKTGRTHQIRVHLTAMNHPVVGDLLYSGKKRFNRDKDLFKRLFLHASKIQFMHPVLNKEIIIESPLPADITTVLDFK